MFILTLLCLCFSCFGGYVHNERIIDEHTQQNVKYLNYNDEYGIQLYMNSADFMSFDFLKVFLFNLPIVNINLRPDNTNTGLLDLQSGGKLLHTDSNGTILHRNPLNNVNLVRVWKSTSTTINMADYSTIKSHYYLTLFNGSNILIEYQYDTYFPIFDDNEFDMGFSIAYAYISISNVNYEWFYYENNNDTSYTPLIDYFYSIEKANYVKISNDNYQSGYTHGYFEGNQSGYQEGYLQGITDTSYDTTAQTIFNGIFTVALLPTNVMLQMMNFEVFGVNIGGLASGLLTIAIVVIILRFVMGKKDD